MTIAEHDPKTKAAPPPTRRRTRCARCKGPKPAHRCTRQYCYCSRECTLLAVGLPADFDPSVLTRWQWTRDPVRRAALERQVRTYLDDLILAVGR